MTTPVFYIVVGAALAVGTPSLPRVDDPGIVNICPKESIAVEVEEFSDHRIWALRCFMGTGDVETVPIHDTRNNFVQPVAPPVPEKK